MQFLQVDRFDDDAVWHSLSGWETAAVVLDYVDYVVGVVVFFFAVGGLLPEGDDDAVLKVVEDLGVVPSDELQQLVLQLWSGHLLEDKRGLGEHSDGL